MPQPIDDGIGERILCHCCGVWREVALQHLTSSNNAFSIGRSLILEEAPDARINVSAKAAWPPGHHVFAFESHILRDMHTILSMSTAKTTLTLRRRKDILSSRAVT